MKLVGFDQLQSLRGVGSGRKWVRICVAQHVSETTKTRGDAGGHANLAGTPTRNVLLLQNVPAKLAL
jgi:hypothetical protein